MPSTIDADSLLPSPAWTILRAVLQRRLDAHLRLQTLALGPCMRLRYEDELTLRHGLQDELLADDERADAAVRQACIALRKRLLPDGRDWRATLTLLPSDPPAPYLEAAAGLVHVQVGIERVLASSLAQDGDLPALYLGESSSSRPLRFALTDTMRAALSGGASASLVCTHPLYSWRRTLPAATLRALCRHLRFDSDVAATTTVPRRHRAVRCVGELP